MNITASRASDLPGFGDTTYSRRRVLGGAGRVAAAAAVGALVGSHALAPSRARAASATSILFTSFGYTCEAPIFVAQAQGYFKDEGLDVTLAGAANPTEAFARLAKGTADAATQSAINLTPPWLPAGMQPGDLVATGGLERGCASLLVAAGSAYQSLADLKGQKVAAGLPNRFAFGEPMAQVGVNPLKDIPWQPALPMPAVAAALANNTVAAAIAVEPLTETLMSAGVVRALAVLAMPPMMMDYCCSVIVPGALLRTDRSKVAAITRALMRGSAWAAAHPAETAQLEVADKRVTATLAENQRAIGTIAFVPSVAAAQANTRDQLGRMVKLGFLDPATDVAATVDRMYVPVTPELSPAAQGTAQLPKSGGVSPGVPLASALGLVGLGLLARARAAPR